MILFDFHAISLLSGHDEQLRRPSTEVRHRGARHAHALRAQRRERRTPEAGADGAAGAPAHHLRQGAAHEKRWTAMEDVGGCRGNEMKYDMMTYLSVVVHKYIHFIPFLWYFLLLFATTPCSSTQMATRIWATPPGCHGRTRSPGISRRSCPSRS